MDIWSVPHRAYDVDTAADDATLVAEATRNREAFAALYHRYATGVYRYMLVHVGNVQDAQDLTAQTFLAGLEGINSFAGKGTFAAWLFAIAHRKAMDYFRRHKATVQLDSLVETPHPGRLPDQIVQDRFDYEQLSVAIRCLTPDRAEAITLRVFAELSISEIAVLMDRNPAAVRMLLSRAMHDLKRRLTCQSIGDEDRVTHG